MDKRWLMVVGIGIAALLLVACGGNATSQDGSFPLDPASAVGKPAPDFTLERWDGGQVALSDYRGQAVLVNFLHTWCVPCNESAPHFQNTVEAHSGEFVVLSLDENEPLADVEAFAQRHGATYPILLDDGTVMATYGVTQMPTSFFVDREGIIRAVNFGTIDQTWLETQLAALE
jgi:peroxiredoxin